VTSLVSDLAGKAPSSGSANYIQNQNALTQNAKCGLGGEVKTPTLNIEISGNPSFLI
jgi:hypothetical protein